MATDAERFDWRATSSKRRSVPLAWLTVVSASAAAGVLFGQVQSIETLVSAIERNGVPARQASQAPEQISSQRIQLVNAPAQTPAVAPPVILLNPRVGKETPKYAALSNSPKSVRRTRIAKRTGWTGPRLAIRLFGRNSVH
jgi:hypothetical protein